MLTPPTMSPALSVPTLVEVPTFPASPIPVRLLSGHLDGGLATVAATVTVVGLRVTGQRDKWASVTLEDGSGSVECLVFPPAFREFGATIAVGVRLLVRGRVDRRQHPVRLVAMDVTRAVA